MSKPASTPRTTATTSRTRLSTVPLGAVLLLALLSWGCPKDPPPVGGEEDTGSAPDTRQVDEDTGQNGGMDASDATGGDAGPGGDGGEDTGNGMGGDGGPGGDGGEADCSNQECDPPEVVCTQDGLFRQCVPDRNGCGTLELPDDCPSNQICAEGGCQETNPCLEGTDNCGPNAVCKASESAAKGYTCECGSQHVDYFGDGTLCYDSTLTLADPGTFEMGSPASETGRDDDETRHSVALTRPFLVAPYEVLVSQWSQHLPNAMVPSEIANSNCDFPSCPMRSVTWWAALKFLNGMSKSDGLEACYTLKNCSGTPGDGFTCSGVDFKGLDCKGWRLPTEAEWEYAARAGTDTALYNGDLTQPGTQTEDPKLGAIAWYGANSMGRIHSGGSKTKNPWDLFDTSGNVAEWVWDRYEQNLGDGKVTDPTGPNSGMERVIRGGHWDSPAEAARSAARDKATPDTRNNKIGFRAVRTMPPKSN